MKIVPYKGGIISFHPRKQHNFEQAAGLADLFPETFKHVTSIYVPPLLVKLMQKIAPRYADQLGKRSYNRLPKKYVYTLPLTEVRKFLIKRKRAIDLEEYLNLNEYWQKKVLNNIDPPEICISYDGVSNLLFRKWKNKSKLVLDLTIGFPQYRMKILHGDHFHMDMLNEENETQKRAFATYKEEVELADLILCGSEFTKKTVVYFYPEFENKCKVLPYGADFEKFNYPQRKFEQKENLKFVFVGAIGWRKGADLVLNAWKDFVVDHSQCELHFFGAADSEIDLTDLPENTFMHGWTKTPELIAYLKQMDVLVFPTTFEGSSYAIYQAMALKLPVITTLNSGTVLTHLESCEMIEVGDKAGLVNAMDKLFGDINYRRQLADNAYKVSRQYTWNDYKIRLGKIIEGVL